MLPWAFMFMSSTHIGIFVTLYKVYLIRAEDQEYTTTKFSHSVKQSHFEVENVMYLHDNLLNSFIAFRLLLYYYLLYQFPVYI